MNSFAGSVGLETVQPQQMSVQGVECIAVGPCRLTFTWWGCFRWHFWYKWTELAHFFVFCSCVCFCLYGRFNCISFHKFFRQLSAFSPCSSSLHSALLVLSTIYLFMKVFFIPDVIFCGWLGLKHQLTNLLTIAVVLLCRTGFKSPTNYLTNLCRSSTCWEMKQARVWVIRLLSCSSQDTGCEQV